MTLFHDCFQINKEQCTYSPYVRFHYVDVKIITTTGSDSLSTYLFSQDNLVNFLKFLKKYYNYVHLSDEIIFSNDPM